MSSAQPAQPGSQPGKSPGLTLNLSSNNPFRNRATSPSPSALSSNLSPTATSPFDDPVPRQRPVSRNPFLDPNYSTSQPNLVDTGSMSLKFDSKASPTAEELFDTLTIDDKKPAAPDGAPPKPPANRPPGPPGRENMPPPGARRGPPPGHRPTRSQEEALRAKRMQMQGGPRPGPSSSPHKQPGRRPRRNSESSVMDVEKPPLTEDEIKAREARRRERERRHRDGKDKKPTRRLDVIDQLDHTSLFGGGYHHDGPFDAVLSHRNRKGSRRAPMQAFPKDSLNMSLGGSGPLNKQADQATLMGTSNEEAFKEYSSGGRAGVAFAKKGELPVFDPAGRQHVLHGEESLGLGTSTFLEGTPAARAAIQKREAEQAEQAAVSDLQRKKSLAHRIRNINNKGQPSGRMTNPEGAYNARSPDSGGERNPFFNEYGKEPESISVRRTDTRSPSSPPPPVPRRGSDMGGPLERRATGEAMTSPTEEGASKPSGGFLSRVKSLKGGRRNRQPSDTMPPPGTAS